MLGLNVVDPSSINPLVMFVHAVAFVASVTLVSKFVPSALDSAAVPASGSAINEPLRPIPAKSKSTAAPVVEFTVLKVTVISLVGVAPPTLVPTIVNVSSLV